MNLELRFFATFRAVVGSKTVEHEFPEGSTIGDVLYAIEDEYPDLAGEIIEDGTVREQVNVLKNGREIVHLDGLATTLADGDAVSVFPPVAGGAP